MTVISIQDYSVSQVLRLVEKYDFEDLCCGSKKKRKKVNRATGPIFKNQLTRTKVFSWPNFLSDIKTNFLLVSAKSVSKLLGILVTL